MARVPRAATVASIAVGVVVVDQLSKDWALRRLDGRAPLEIVGSLQLNLTWNTGASFSIGDGVNIGPYVAVVALVVVAFLLRSGHSATRLGAVAAGLVAGGAVGNLVDRALRSGPAGAEAGFMGGAVVDFVDVGFWPIFNVADAAIVVGALLLVLSTFLGPPPEEPVAGDEGSGDEGSEGPSPDAGPDRSLDGTAS